MQFVLKDFLTLSLWFHMNYTENETNKNETKWNQMYTKSPCKNTGKSSLEEGKMQGLHTYNFNLLLIQMPMI